MFKHFYPFYSSKTKHKTTSEGEKYFFKYIYDFKVVIKVKF